MRVNRLIGALICALLAVGLLACGSDDESPEPLVLAPSPGAGTQGDRDPETARLRPRVATEGEHVRSRGGGERSGRAGGSERRARQSRQGAQPATTPPSGRARPESEPASTTTSDPRPRLTFDAPRGSYPLVWVRKGESVAIRTEPGGGKLVERAGRRTEFGSPTVFGVVRREGDWVGVTTADLPNGRLGWVRLDPRRLAAGWTKMAVLVDLSARRALLLAADRPKRSFPVTVGMPGSETPTGRFAVTDTFRGGLSPAYGCCALAISANQPHLPSGWLGGNRIAIHGTSGPLGVAASHGCVRAADARVSALIDRLPLGAPVFIRA